MSYSNFKDPVGLLKRMLLSGNKAAYFTLFREGVSLLLKPLDFFWKKSEAKKIQTAKPSKLPLIIILGGSRSGTTILYQTLAEYLPVSYFNNLSVSFPRSPITSTRFFRSWFYKKNRVKRFINYYGSVAGFKGPNDAFHIWNAWLGEDRNAIPKDLPDSIKGEMKAFFDAWHEHIGKPFLNKNNRNSLCVDLFLETFEHIHFVEIRRKPEYVVQSLIKSRMAVQGDKHTGWGLATKEESDPNEPFAYIRDICQQVKAVETTLDEARGRVPAGQYTYLSYEQLCENPRSVLEEIYKKAWPTDAPPLDLEHLQTLKSTNRQILPDEEFNEILRILDLVDSSDEITRIKA
ncbi:MAG: sulfotransferase [Bacteroidia bacterium]